MERRSRSTSFVFLLLFFRFAEFIEGQSHLSDREVLDYESEPLLPDDDGDDDAAATWTDDESDD